MRAKDFVNEERNNLPSTAKDALDRMVVMPSMDPYYEYYRFMILAAGEPEVKSPPYGEIRDTPAALPYTDVEMDMLTKALKRMGRPPKFATGPGSFEPEDTNKNSVIPKKKKNRYGV